MKQENRRKFPRILLDDLDEDDAVKSDEARVQNISAGGCFIETDESLEVGDAFDFQWTVPDTGLILSRDGEIAWKQTISDGSNAIYGYGVRFYDTSPDACEEIVGAVQDYRSRKGVPMFRIAKEPPWMFARQSNSPPLV